MEDFVCEPVFRVSKLQSFPQRVMSDGPVCLTFLESIEHMFVVGPGSKMTV